VTHVSSPPSKIPYGGFSPVRLQIGSPDATFPTTVSSGRLYATMVRLAHLCPLPLPLSGGGRGVGERPIQRPLARQRVIVSRRVVAYYGLIRGSDCLPAVSLGIGWALAFRPTARASPIYSACPSFRAAFPARRVRRCLTVPSPPTLAFAACPMARHPAMAHAQVGSRVEYFSSCKVRFMLRPGKLLARHRHGLLRSSFHAICRLLARRI
jgi:hypothetical protein